MSTQKMTKKIFLSVATIFLIWQSFDLLRNIDKLEIASWGWIIFTAWVLNMFITGIFALAGFAYPTQKLLPESYYLINHPQRLKKIYKVLRVDLFRQMLLATLWKSKKQRKKFFNGKKDGFDNLTRQSMKSEFGHLIPFILLLVVTIYLLIIGKNALAVCTFIINFIGNLYPIILQRHHRMRLQLIRRRF